MSPFQEVAPVVFGYGSVCHFVDVPGSSEVKDNQVLLVRRPVWDDGEGSGLARYWRIYPQGRDRGSERQISKGW